MIMNPSEKPINEIFKGCLYTPFLRLAIPLIEEARKMERRDEHIVTWNGK